MSTAENLDGFLRYLFSAFKIMFSHYSHSQLTQLIQNRKIRKKKEERKNKKMSSNNRDIHSNRGEDKKEIEIEILIVFTQGKNIFHP